MKNNFLIIILFSLYSKIFSQTTHGEEYPQLKISDKKNQSIQKELNTPHLSFLESNVDSSKTKNIKTQSLPPLQKPKLKTKERNIKNE